MRLPEFFKKAVCSVVSASVLFLPGWSIAGETNMGAVGREAQKFIQGTKPDESAKSISLQGNTATVKLPNGTTASFDQKEMAPSDAPAGSELQISTTDLNRLLGMHENGAAMDDAGSSEKKDLYQDASKDEPSTVEGNAYKTILDSYNKFQSMPSMVDDAIFDASRETFENLKEIAQGFADCSADTKINEITNKKHVPELHSCTKVLDRSGTCKLTHYYRAGVLAHYSGPYNMASCGEGCMQVWLGDPSDQNLHSGGVCKLFTNEIGIQVLNPEAIQKVVVEDIYWDDQMQIYMGKRGEEQKVFQLPYSETFVPSLDNTPGVRPRFTYPGPFSGAPHTDCEQRISWSWRHANKDVTDIFKNVKQGDVVYVNFRIAVVNNGEGYATMKLYYDPKATIYEEQWTPPECVEALNAIGDGYAEGSSKCTKMPSNLDENGCTSMNGVVVCPDDMVKPPRSDINPLCQEMELTTNYDFYKGQMDCWVDANGKTQCPENVGGNLDTCEKYETDPKCSFVKSECVKGAEGDSGTCYVSDITYDCGEDVEITDKEADTVYNCPGDVACMGNDCIDTSQSVSTSFAEVTALLNALQYMTQDMACTGVDEDGNVTTEEDVTCTVFGGTPGFCKEAVGGVQNCCEPVGGIGIGTYITLIKATADLNSALDDMSKLKEGGFLKDIGSSWVDMKGDVAGVVKDGWSWVGENFSGFADNISGLTDSISSAFTELVDFKKEVMSQIQSKCQEIMTQIFKDCGMDNLGGAVAGSGASAAGDNAASSAAGVVQGIGTIFTVVSWIYTAYVVATMVIQMVYACEDVEYETVSNNEMGNCHRIGTYCKSKVLGVCIEKRTTFCCYKSPLSRIMNEQIRLQGDILGEEYNGFGSVENPRCDGIPLDRVGEVDWDRIDLSEWIAILERTGNLPDDDTISIDSLTGIGSKMDTDGTRLNTIDRTHERLEGIDVDGVREETSKKMVVDTGAGDVQEDN